MRLFNNCFNSFVVAGATQVVFPVICPSQPCVCPSCQSLTLQWRHNEHDGVSNHQPHNCLLNLLSKRRSKKTSKLRVTGLCAENSPVIGEFSAQRASEAENVSIWWRHHENITHECIRCSIFDLWWKHMSTFFDRLTIWTEILFINADSFYLIIFASVCEEIE